VAGKNLPAEPLFSSRNHEFLWDGTERNSMNRAISLALFIGGIVLIAYGISASNSFSSGISRAFIGAPTEKTTWLLICGGAAAIVGHAGMIRGSRKP
jgi:hypothetical protein